MSREKGTLLRRISEKFLKSKILVLLLFIIILLQVSLSFLFLLISLIV